MKSILTQNQALRQITYVEQPTTATTTKKRAHPPDNNNYYYCDDSIFFLQKTEIWGPKKVDFYDRTPFFYDRKYKNDRICFCLH